MLRFMSFPAVFGLLVCQWAVADEGDFETAFLASKSEFNAAIEAAQTELIARLRTKAESVQKAGKLAELMRIEAEIKAFELEGKLPTILSTRSFEHGLRVARNKLDTAYVAAVKEFTRAGQHDRAKETQSELEEFRLRGGGWKPIRLATFEILSGSEGAGPLSNDYRLFSNRKYVWQNIPKEFPLTRHAIIAGDEQTPLRIEVSAPGWIYAAMIDGGIEDASEFAKQHDWEPMPRTFNYNDKSKTAMRIYRKEFLVGTFEIPRFGFASPIPLLE